MSPYGFWQNLLFRASALMILVGAACCITGRLFAFWLFAAGGIVFSIVRMMSRYNGHAIAVKRLHRQQLVGTLFLLLSVAAMGMQTFRLGWFEHNEWMVFLLIFCVYEVYTAFRIPVELEKEKAKKK
jgi:putative membrane protein